MWSHDYHCESTSNPLLPSKHTLHATASTNGPRIKGSRYYSFADNSSETNVGALPRPRFCRSGPSPPPRSLVARSQLFFREARAKSQSGRPADSFGFSVNSFDSFLSLSLRHFFHATPWGRPRPPEIGAARGLGSLPRGSRLQRSR